MPRFKMPNRGRNIRFGARERRQAIVRPPNNLGPKPPANNLVPKPPLVPPKPANNLVPKPPLVPPKPANNLVPKPPLVPPKPANNLGPKPPANNVGPKPPLVPPKPANNLGPKPPLVPPKPANNLGPKPPANNVGSKPPANNVGPKPPPKNIAKKQMDDIIREQLNKLRNETLTEKGRGYGRLLINLPINHPMRTNVKTRILEEVRKAERMRPTINAARLLQNLKTNLGPIKNKNITNRINLALKRLEENARYTRRPSWTPMNMFGRGPRFLPPQLSRMFGYPEPPRAPRMFGYPEPPPAPRNLGNPYPPPPPPPRELVRNFNALPPAQKNAVQQAGGINTSLQIIRNGGGAQEVARAAEALNEFPNSKQAMEIKNVKPAAIAAVKAIGTPNRAMNVVNAVTNMNVRVSPTPVNKKAPQPIRVKLMKEIIKRLTKQEIIQLVGESSLGNKKANSKNELVKNFTKFIRRQPKKKRSVAGSNNGAKV